jgi:four helix bundle protein
MSLKFVKLQVKRATLQTLNFPLYKLNMMKIKRFEDIIAWQKAKELSVQVYGLFENSKDFGFKDQIQRASVSVMNNIAEGFERRGNKEFRHFLYIAKGSCGEVRSMLYLAKELIKYQKRILLVFFGYQKRFQKSFQA